MSNVLPSSRAADVGRSAAVSGCGRYRWWLRRTLPGGPGRVVCFLMLNPSRADATIDDPTIRRCWGFARRWGFGVLEVRNLFCWRSAEPRSLLTAADPTGGPRGDRELVAAAGADLVVAAWGGWVPFERDRVALRLLGGRRLMCLGRTRNGGPRHPLYVSGATGLEVFPAPFPLTAAGRCCSIPQRGLRAGGG
jgi:hypothetical protein